MIDREEVVVVVVMVVEERWWWVSYIGEGGGYLESHVRQTLLLLGPAHVAFNLAAETWLW
ncbi:hypothetical protein Hanom_Chr03g00259871 [Helianthus anomalus]